MDGGGEPQGMALFSRTFLITSLTPRFWKPPRNVGFISLPHTKLYLLSLDRASEFMLPWRKATGKKKDQKSSLESIGSKKQSV